MTPPATTAAGRRASTAAQPVPAPRAPRRVSGPIRGRMPATAPRPVRQPPRPARKSRQPVRHAPRRHSPPLGQGLAHWIRGLPDHALVDRLVRGRAWIPVLGVLLAGIVAMQVEVLKLGTSMGRWIERSSALQSRNELLRANVTWLADDQRIESLAAGMGMVMPAPTGLNFLSARRGLDGVAATAHIHRPDATQFIAALPAAATQDPTATGVAPPGVAASATSTSTSASQSSTGAAAAASPASSAATTSSTSATGSTQPASSAGGAGATAPAASAPTQSSGGATPTGGASPNTGG